MPTTIKDVNGKVLLEVSEDSSLAEALSGKAFNEANLEGMYFSGIHLERTSFFWSNLESVNFREARLDAVNFSTSNVRNADFRGANLSGSHFMLADLSGANLERSAYWYADMRLATLSDETVLPNGITYGEFVHDVVPVLLTAGGRSIEELTTPDIWTTDHRTWGAQIKWRRDNCIPIATAFGVDEVSEIPALYRPMSRLFIYLFNNEQIPKPEVPSVTS